MWFDSQAVNEMAKERIETGMRNAQMEARLRGYDQPPRRRFNLVAAITRLFQGRRPEPVNTPETKTQRRTA